MPPGPVVVTGLGAVTPAGWGLDRFADLLRAARPALGPFTRFDHSGHRTHIAGEVPAPPSSVRRRGWGRLSHSERFALFAASEAVAQAALPAPLADTRVGVYFASSTGGLFETERYFLAELRPAARRARRTLLASHALSAPAEAIARELAITGPVETVVSSCAAGALAIRQALDAVRDGDVDVAITGGADCLCLTTYSGFDSLRAMDERPCRPFRTDRAGLSLGEGAGVLVLETLAHAEARGARPVAELAGAGASCDAGHMTAPDPEGQWAALAIRQALDDAGLGAAEIDFVNAHGTATPLNDAAEAAALRQVFGDRTAAMPLEATKGLIGHLLGAAGAVEAVVTAYSLASGLLHATPGTGTVDPALAPGLVVDRSRSGMTARAGLSVNLGFGGANAALAFRRWSAA